MKKQIKETKKIWKTLKTAFKWLFLIILIFLLLSLIKDFLDYHNFLINKVQQQNTEINNLQDTVYNLKTANSHLVNQLQLEHTKVEHLQDQLSIKINNQPVNVTVDDIKQEVESQLKFPDSNFVPVTIVGILSIMKAFAFKLAF